MTPKPDHNTLPLDQQARLLGLTPTRYREALAVPGFPVRGTFAAKRAWLATTPQPWPAAAPVETLSTKQLAAACHVTERAVQFWVKAGCPVQGTDRHRRFDLSAVRGWLALTATGGGAAAKQAALAASAGVAPVAPPLVVPGPADAVFTGPAPPAGDGGDVAALLARLRAAEALTHQQWAGAVARGASAADCKLCHAAWQTTVESRRRVERDAARILRDAGTYVEAAAAEALFTRAVAEMVSVLDQLGIIMGERLVSFTGGLGRPATAGDYRLLIDAEVERAKALCRRALVKLGNSEDGNARGRSPS